MEMWPFEVLPRRLFKELRMVVGHYYTDLIEATPLRYVKNVACEE